MITITINDREITLERPMTVLEAARSAGIYIPTLCHHKQLDKHGGCRLCLVEVERMPRLQTACTLIAADGMVIRTETETVRDARTGILELLLINHPLECPYCDKAGECELQDLVGKYSPSCGRYSEDKRTIAEDLEDPLIARNMGRCVNCERCVRMCRDVQGASAIAVMNRGPHSRISPFDEKKFDCEYCGNCITVCPVGALTSKLHRHSYRPWQMSDSVETVCPYCGVGCTVALDVRDDKIVRVVPKAGSAVNNGLLCARGRFGHEFASSPERLSKPLIRMDSDTSEKVSPEFREATWEEAIDIVAKKLGGLKDEFGGRALAGIASPRCTNEDNYVFQEFFRKTLGSNNIDSMARTGYAGALAFIENVLGAGSTSIIISGISNSDTVLVVGGDPFAINPIVGLDIRACSRSGGKVLCIGRASGLGNFTEMALTPGLFTEAVLMETLVTELKRIKRLPGSRPLLEEKIKDIEMSADDAEKSCVVPKDDLLKFIGLLSEASALSVVIGKDIMQSRDGSYKLLLICAIAYLTNASVYLLSDRPNEQGLLDMGCDPAFLPGYVPVTSGTDLPIYAAERMPSEPGMSLFEMIDAAEKGELKAMYVMGENPAFNLPDSGKSKSALRNLEFLVVQDIFLTETAMLADVVLPAFNWSEKDGTFTNLERRVQSVRKAGRPGNGEAMDDWEIISMVSRAMGTDMGYSSAGEVFDEIARVSPLYKGLKPAEIEKAGALWPYHSKPGGSEGDIVTVKGGCGCDKGKLYLGLDRLLFHSGTLSRNSPALMRLCGEAVLKLSPSAAASLSLEDGDLARVSAGQDSLELPVVIDKTVGESLVMVSNNFRDKGAFALMRYTIDPITKAAVTEGNVVTVTKSGPGLIK